jgi:hypothetical protein
MQKEKDLEEAEERIMKLREELTFLEDSFEVVAKRPLVRSELDSPELHAEKKVKIEEVPDIKSVEIIKSIEDIKSVEIIKSIEDIKSMEIIKSIKDIKSIEDIKSMEIIKSIKDIKSMKIMKKI